MSDDTTTTDDGVIDTGADNAQPVDNYQDAAVTETEPSTEASNDDTNEPSNDDNSNDVVEWAKKKGLPLSEQPTDNELKLAQMQREAEKRMHTATTQAGAELGSAYKEQISNEAMGMENITQRDLDVAQIKAELMVERFFRETPEAAQYEEQMKNLVIENPSRASLPLDDLYDLAVTRSGKYERAEQEGAKKALQGLAQKQKAAAPTGNAVNSGVTSGGITRDLIAQKTRQGDIQWLTQNESSINQLMAEGKL